MRECLGDVLEMRRHFRLFLAVTLASRAALGEPSSAPTKVAAPTEPPAPTPAPTASAPPTGGPATETSRAAPSQPATATGAPTTTPSPVAQVAASASAPLSGSARIRIASDYADAWLETRPFGGGAAWQRGCPAPCGQVLLVEDIELRVTAPDMTPSKPFRVEPGGGSALLSVSGGSTTARTWGRVTFAVGVPVTLLGMTGFALGSFDDR